MLRKVRIRFQTACLLVGLAVVSARDARAQDPQEHHHMEEPPAAWTWFTDANIFFGYNYQERKFTDFSSWESQNWFMLEGRRKLGDGQLTLESMMSLEPFTEKRIGSPQVFQTGETYRSGPL